MPRKVWTPLTVPITKEDSGVSGAREGKALRTPCLAWEWCGDGKKSPLALPEPWRTARELRGEA